jgi:zeta-carotene desaturase
LLDADYCIKKNISHYKLSPIMGIHLWLDRRIMELPNLCLPGNFIQWIFDKTPGEAVSKASSQYLSIVISASQEIMHLPQKEIIDTTLQELKKVFPAAQEACMVHSLIIREPRATFKLMELQDSYRLGPVSGITGLYLAGDWTDTGWPATMESAALSGFAAARQVINQEPF